MTGFAAEEGALTGGERYLLSLKGVNHRFLDLQFRLPHGSEALEAQLRRTLKEKIGRGHVDLSLEVNAGAATGGVQIDGEVFRRVVGALQTAAREAGITDAIEPGAILRVPGVLVTGGRGTRVSSEELLRVVPEVAGRVLELFQATREREGAELGKELRDGMRRLTTLLERARELRAGVRQGQFTRMQGRLAELLADTAISEERVLTEAAIMADRSDVEEEMVRLRTHIEHFTALLGASEPVGKRMDFLLQEFNREANTMVAKSGSAAGQAGIDLVGLGLEMKAEIERAREQVQNIE